MTVLEGYIREVNSEDNEFKSVEIELDSRSIAKLAVSIDAILSTEKKLNEAMPELYKVMPMENARKLANQLYDSFEDNGAATKYDIIEVMATFFSRTFKVRNQDAHGEE